MRILVDENIPKLTVRTLSEQGHDVEDLRGSEYEGIPDSKVWDMAQKQKRLLITTDKWFGTIFEQPHNGVLIVLLKHPNLHSIHSRIIQAIDSLPETVWPGLIMIVRDNVRSVRRIR